MLAIINSTLSLGQPSHLPPGPSSLSESATLNRARVSGVQDSFADHVHPLPYVYEEMTHALLHRICPRQIG
jgi:hypothetical protein